MVCLPGRSVGRLMGLSTESVAELWSSRSMFTMCRPQRLQPRRAFQSTVLSVHLSAAAAAADGFAVRAMPTHSKRQLLPEAPASLATRLLGQLAANSTADGRISETRNAARLNELATISADSRRLAVELAAPVNEPEVGVSGELRASVSAAERKRKRRRRRRHTDRHSVIAAINSSFVS